MKVLTVWALAFLTVVPVAPAKTQTFEKLGVSLDVPEGWNDSPDIARAMRPPAELIAGLIGPGGQRTFTALSAELKPNEAPGFTKGLLDSLQKQGFTLSADMPVVINGVSFDSYTGTRAGASAPILQVFSTFANGRAFAISIGSQIGDPTQDAELQALVHSFRFLTPPQSFPPVSAAYNTGYQVGRAIGMFVCPLLGLLLLGGLAGGGYFLFRKKK